jgi:hypothetical protein
MLVPQLLRALWPIVIGALVVTVVCVLALNVVPEGVLKSHPWPRRVLWLAPFAYPLAFWALFSWAAGHDRRLEAHLKANGAAASAIVSSVRDLGLDVNVNPVLMLHLRVTPSGAEPFDAEVSVNPSRLQMHTFQPGTTVRVRYDPQDRSRLALEE